MCWKVITKLLPNDTKYKLPTTSLVVSVAEIYQDIPKDRAKDAEKDVFISGVNGASPLPVWALLVRVQALYWKHSWYFVRKNKKGNAKSEKKTKLYKKMNDFISWSLPNLWDISEVII